MELTCLIFFEREKLNCGVYIIAFECLSKLFYSFFSAMIKTGRRQAVALSARRVRAGLKISGWPAVFFKKAQLLQWRGVGVQERSRCRGLIAACPNRPCGRMPRTMALPSLIA